MDGMSHTGPKAEACATGRHPFARVCSCSRVGRRFKSPPTLVAAQPISDALFFPRLGRWAERAACRGEDDHTVLGTFSTRTEAAKEVCRGCPVRWACLEDALATHPDMDYHVRGGTTPSERDRIRRWRR